MPPAPTGCPHIWSPARTIMRDLQAPLCSHPTKSRTPARASITQPNNKPEHKSPTGIGHGLQGGRDAGVVEAPLHAAVPHAVTQIARAAIAWDDRRSLQKALSHEDLLYDEPATIGCSNCGGGRHLQPTTTLAIVSGFVDLTHPSSLPAVATLRLMHHSLSLGCAGRQVGWGGREVGRQGSAGPRGTRRHFLQDGANPPRHAPCDLSAAGQVAAPPAREPRQALLLPEEGCFQGEPMVARARFTTPTWKENSWLILRRRRCS
jgi:hypothetical protein